MNVNVIAHHVCQQTNWTINNNTLNQLLYVLAVNYVPHGKLIDEPFYATECGPKVFFRDRRNDKDIITEDDFPALNLSCPEPILHFIKKGTDYWIALGDMSLKFMTQLQVEGSAYWKNYKNDTDVEIPYDDIINEYNFETEMINEINDLDH